MIEKIWALVLYVLLAAVVWGPVVFMGKTLSPAMYQPHGVVSGWPDGYKGRVPVNLFNVDLATPAYYEWPVNRLVGDIYRAGELPLWNPYQAAGTPLAAQYSTRAFFPYQIAEDLSPPEYWDFFMLGRLVIAGFFTFLFLRTLGAGFGGSFLAGAFFMLSGSFTWFINLEQLANNAMMLPVFLWSLERLFKWGRGREAALGGLAFGLVLLAGQPETALYVLLLGTAYYIVRVATEPKKAVRHARNIVVTALIGLALSAPLTIPFAELVGNSHFAPASGAAIELKGVIDLPPAAGFLTPNAHEFIQDPLTVPSVPLAVQKTPGGDDFFFRVSPVKGAWDRLGGYSGAVCLYVMLAGFFTMLLMWNGAGRGFRAPVIFFIAFGSLAAGKSLLAPYSGFIEAYLPGGPVLSGLLDPRWAGPAWTFSFAAAAGLGYHVIKTAFSGTDNPGAVEAGPAFGPVAEPYGPEAGTDASGSEAASHVAALADEARAGTRQGKSPYIAFIPALGALLVLFALLIPLDTIAMFIRNADNRPFLESLGPSLITGTFLTVVFLGAAFALSVLHVKKKTALYALVPLGLLELWWAVPRGYGYEWLFLKLAPLLIGFYAVTRYALKKRTMAVAASFLFFLSFLLLDMNSPSGLPERYDTFAEPPFVGFLKNNAKEGRIVAGDGILFPDYSGALGLSDIRYINSRTVDTFHEFRSRRLHVYEPIDGSASPWFTGRPEAMALVDGRPAFMLRGMEKDVLDRLADYSLLGVSHMVLPRGTELDAAAAPGAAEADKPGLSLVYDREVRIYENPGALPRAYLAYGVGQAKDYKEAQATTAGRDFIPGNSAVVEKELPGWFEPDSPGTGSGTARITMAGTNRVTVEVDSDAQGLLVLNDVYYPGWSAYVDGVKTEVYRTNGLVRGVFIDRGSHSVEFKYLPLSFVIGAGIALVGAVSCIYLTVIDVLRRTRRWQGL